MNPIARLLIIAGVVLLVIGTFWQLAGRYLPLGRLPGDIAVERNHVRVYFPVVTCLVLSAVATLVLWLWRWLRP